MSRMMEDPRIDPRFKAAFGQMRAFPLPNFDSRDELVAAMNRPEVLQGLREAQLFTAREAEAVAPSKGLTITTETFVSEPDGNTIKVSLMRPQLGDQSDGPLPCVYYIHGGGMAVTSAFDVGYQAWGRMIANQRVAVAMVDFRNCVVPSSAPEIAPYPAGLNDCVSGLRWLISQADEFGIDAGRILVAGSSGGGNLALALGLRLTREGDAGLVKGLYAMCPDIAGSRPRDDLPSSIENNDVWLDSHSNFSRLGYGMDAFEAQDPEAWPLFATEEHVQGFPETVISVNECDPLRDEGIEFYRLLLRAGQRARCRQVMGTIHGGDNMVLPCTDLALATTRDMAALARGD
ncbi:MAG: alpha/beta hydrolase [Chloroflexi bacterium]|nr:alpha/beta hydrolase [Chloroflexota bacterium]MCY3588253.1 alpha/beta hydrolase [Chloroflexota bacterium]MCY3684928.1 alpha/beta hydrolase [Chloroflexota bacterium]MDE2707582.1 alpha/beta hydrolase [Chloroflexota bacterium]